MNAINTPSFPSPPPVPQGPDIRLAPPPPPPPPVPSLPGTGLAMAAPAYQPRPVVIQPQARSGWEGLEAVAGMTLISPITTLLGGLAGFMVAGPVGVAAGAILGSSLPGAYFALKEGFFYLQDRRKGESKPQINKGIVFTAIAVPAIAGVGALVGGLVGGPIGAGIGASLLIGAPALLLGANSLWNRLRNKNQA